MSMAAENDGQIPLVDGLHLDAGGVTVEHYALSEDTQISGECPCDIGEMANFFASQAASELCMRSAMIGSGAQEAYIEVAINCEGPKRRLFGGKKCGAEVTIREVDMPIEEVAEEDPEEAQQPEILEVVPGVTLASLIADCRDKPSRIMPVGDATWTDKKLNIPGISSALHISVATVEGDVRVFEFHTPDNPYTPPKIHCDVTGDSGKLVIKHNDVAEEADTEEIFGLDERAKLDKRATQLFSKYFVRD